MDRSSGHWSQLAQLWNQTGPPLKATPEDLEHYWSAISLWQGGGPPRVLILGVTQELYKLPWPSGARVSALDNTQQMIDRVWLGPASDATCGDWTAMPLADQSCDIAVCDGGLTMLEYPEGIRKTALELSRVLGRNGVCVFRLYTPPKVREEPSQVFEELLSGTIPDLSHFKLRIANAMQSSPVEGVVLDDIWQALHRVAPDFDLAAPQIGWPLEHLKAIDTYRGSKDIYRFMSVDQIREVFEAAGFGHRGTWKRTDGNRYDCPVVAFGL